MHMADALVSAAVGSSMWAVSAGTLGYAVTKVKTDFDEKKIPVMGVMGAFVFAAQMINFTIPGTGSSGHIGGAVLLAGLLGAFPAYITLACVLAIQALFFADGGLLALGCNIFNMGFWGCFLAFPLIFKPILKRGINKKRITAASILSVVAGLQLGAFSVVLETLVSGITELPFQSFVLLMQPIHLAIGVVEGIITAAVLCFVHSVRPELLESAVNGTGLGKSISIKRVTVILAVLAVLIGGGLSLAASANPDGLEWAMENVAGTAELEGKGNVYKKAGKLQEATSFLPDYSFKDSDSAAGTAVSGLLGGAITLIASAAIGAAIYTVKKRKKVN